MAVSWRGGVATVSEVLTTHQVILRCNIGHCTQALVVVMSEGFFEQFFEGTDGSFTELARHHPMYNRAGWRARPELDLDFCLLHHDSDERAKVPEVWLENAGMEHPSNTHLSDEEIERMTR